MAPHITSMSIIAKENISSLRNHFLLATPSLVGSNFSGSVIYICEHNSEGAMGLIINQKMHIAARTVFDQLELEYHEQCGNSSIFDGGPLQPDLGFILHRNSQRRWETTMRVSKDVSLTVSKDILSDIAMDKGPVDSLIALGYCSWQSGQLEEELKENAWLVVPADSSIIFDTECSKRAEAVASLIGVDISRLALEAGNA
jgi:putative transcriptional regulator